MKRRQPVTTTTLLRALGDEQRRVGIEVGRLAAVREASGVLLRLIDGAKSKTERELLEDARRKIERLTTEPLA